MLVSRSGSPAPPGVGPPGISGTGRSKGTLLAMEREWITRLRWRMRGAWLWPSFVVLTVADGLLLHHLPVYGAGPGSFVGALLTAGFLNLFVVAVLAPLGGRRLRRRRPDLPRFIADNYAGTTLVAVVAVAVMVGGLLHRPAVAAEREAEAAAVAGVHEYVTRSADPEYRAGLAGLDMIRVDDDIYRSCVPGRDPKRWLCLIVNTQQRPAGVAVDSDRAPNSAYRAGSGFE